MPFTGFVSVFVSGLLGSGGGQNILLNVATKLSLAGTGVTRLALTIPGSTSAISRALQDPTAGGREMRVFIPQGVIFNLSLTPATTLTNNCTIDLVFTSYDKSAATYDIQWNGASFQVVDDTGTPFFPSASPSRELSINGWPFVLDGYWEGSIGSHPLGRLRLQNSPDNGATWINVWDLQTTSLGNKYARIPYVGPLYRIVAGEHLATDVGRLLLCSLLDSEVLNYGSV
jgi:hypothetical protein